MTTSMRVLLVLATLLELGSTLMTVRTKEDYRQGHDLLLVDGLGLEGSATMLKPWGEEQLPWPQHDSPARCEDAREGSNCYEAVMYLKNIGFKRHPAWFPGLTSKSLFPDVQAVLNKTGKSKCPKPCAMTIEERIEMKEAGMVTEAVTAKMTDKSCHDIAEDGEEGWDRCRRAIAWMTTRGIVARPDWYPTLGVNSSREDVQEELYRQSKAECPRPCRPERDTLAPAPPLAPAASAGVPTATAPQAMPPADGAAQPGLDSKPLRDMTPNELKKFIAGTWDGGATTKADVAVEGVAPAEARVPEQAAPADTPVEEPAASSVSEDEAAAMETEVMKDMADAKEMVGSETPTATSATAQPAEEAMNATTEKMKETDSKTSVEDEAAGIEPEVMKDMDVIEAGITNYTADATTQVENMTTAQDEMQADMEAEISEAEMKEAEINNVTADVKPQVESEITGHDEVAADMEADAKPQVESTTTAQDEMQAEMEAAIMEHVADVKPQAESRTTLEDEWAAEMEATIIKHEADAKLQVESKTTAPQNEFTMSADPSRE